MLMKNNWYLQRIVLLIVLFINGLELFAEEVNIGGLTYYLSDDGTADVIGTNDSLPSNVVIPSTVVYENKIYKVTNVCQASFSDCATMESISIPSSVTYIGAKKHGYTSLYPVFRDCPSLKKIVIEDGTTPITIRSVYVDGRQLFENCPLGELYLGRNIKIDEDSSYPFAKYPQKYNYSPFYNLKGLKNITISSSVTELPDYLFYKNTACTTMSVPAKSIGKHTFEGCTNITKLTLQDKVETIGDNAFYGCSAIAEIGIGSGLKTIGDSAFYNCSSLPAVLLPNSFKELGMSAFEGCKQMSIVKLGNTLTAIPAQAFKNCTSLSEMNIPQTVEYIGDQALMNDSSIVILSLQEGLDSIGKQTFYNLSGIVSLSIPSTVTTMGQDSFYGCTHLASLTFKDADDALKIDNTYNSRSLSLDYDYFYDCPIRTLYLGRNLEYQSSEEYSYRLGKEWVYTGKASAPFANSTTLKNITIGPKVTVISENLFNNCDCIESVVVPASISMVKDYAFYGCDKLSSVQFEETSEHELHIYSEAFGYCTALTSIVFPYQLSSIGSAFNGCTSLKNIIFNNNSSYEPQLRIGNGTFASCPIETLTLPGRLISIGDCAFSGCSCLRELTFLDSKYDVRLGCGAMRTDKEGWGSNLPLFEGCNLEKLYIGRNIVYTATSKQGYSPFYNQNNLTDITFSQAGTVTYCKDYLFYNVNNCKTLILPESLTSIGNSTFQGMSSLEKIEIPNNVTTIGTYAFADDKKMLSVKLSTSCPWLKEGLFSNCDALQSITIPSVVTQVDTKTFANCKALSNVNIEEGTGLIAMGYGASQEDYGLFRDCPVETLYLGRGLSYDTEIASRSPFYSISTLRNLTFGKSMAVVDKYMFYGCTGLEEVHLPDNITSVGAWGFYGCTALKTVRLSEKLSQVADYGFSECKSLDNVVFPASMTSVADNSFSNCTSLKTLDLGPSLMIIGPSAFENDSTLQGIEIPETLYSLGVASFKNCVSLSNVALKNISSVPKQAFQGCTGLKWVSLNSKTTSLGENSFEGCCNISYVRSYAGTPPEGLPNFPADVVNNGTLYIPKKYVENYKNSPTWQDWLNMVLENIPVSSITLDKGSANVKVAETVTLTATVGADDADNKDIEWKSADESIATVDATGVITAVGVGETDITAIAADGSGIKAVCHVTVEPTLVVSIEMSESALSVKKYHEASLSATVLPVTTTNKTLTWTSSDPTIATVDAEGNIKALLAGNTVIKATATDGSGMYAECNLTVTPPISGDSNDDDDVNIVDAVNTVNYILNKVTGTFVFEAADVNKDGSITISDVTGTTSLIMAQNVAAKEQVAAKALAGNGTDVDNLVFTQNDNASLGIRLDNASNYVALQADITLPINAKNAQVRLSDVVASTHQLTSTLVDDNTLRVAVYSLGNNPLADGEDILTISADKTFKAEDVQIIHAVAADAEAAGFTLSGRFDNTTAINDNVSDDIVSVKGVDGGIIVSGNADAQVNIHTMSGVLVKSFRLAADSCKVGLTHGIYLVSINGQTKKITIK